MITEKHMRRLRAAIVKGSASLSDEEALLSAELFPFWEENDHYENGVRVRDPYDGYLYKLIPASHESQSDWPPHLVPAIWRRVDEPEEEWPEWRQPSGAHDSYDAGAKVSHNGLHWINAYGDGNIWEPGVYGWELADEP